MEPSSRPTWSFRRSRPVDDILTGGNEFLDLIAQGGDFTVRRLAEIPVVCGLPLLECPWQDFGSVGRNHAGADEMLLEERDCPAVAR